MTLLECTGYEYIMSNPNTGGGLQIATTGMPSLTHPLNGEIRSVVFVTSWRSDKGDYHIEYNLGIPRKLSS